jgi:FRG domain protein
MSIINRKSLMSDNDTHFLRDVKLNYDQVSQIMSGPRSVIDSDSMRQAIATFANNVQLTDEARKNMIEAMSRLASVMRYTSRTDKKDYQHLDTPRSPYSPTFISPGDYFKKHEKIIRSFEDLNSAIAQLISNVGMLQLVWRGHSNSEWGIHSGLYRALMEVNKVEINPRKARGDQPFPTEEQVIAAEKEILKAARTDWRLDGQPALETFARIQHEGGLTRLLDVTKNPYIAAWFAVESGQDEVDGRLIAFARTSIRHLDSNKIAGSDVEEGIVLDELWRSYQPLWHNWNDNTSRQNMDWGTGGNRRIWTPPAYHARISTQNAAFLVDGVPITTNRVRRSLNRPRTGKIWTRADVLASSSILSKIVSTTTPPRATKANLAPTFTFLIKADAKKEIHDFLESRFGYTRSYIYPDMSAFAQYTRHLPLPSLNDIESQE